MQTEELEQPTELYEPWPMDEEPEQLSMFGHAVSEPVLKLEGSSNWPWVDSDGRPLPSPDFDMRVRGTFSGLIVGGHGRRNRRRGTQRLVIEVEVDGLKIEGVDRVSEPIS